VVFVNGISTQTLNILSCGRVTRFGNDTSSKLNKTVAVVAYAALAALTLALSIRISEWALKNRQAKIINNNQTILRETVQNNKELVSLSIELKSIDEELWDVRSSDPNYNDLNSRREELVGEITKLKQPNAHQSLDILPAIKSLQEAIYKLNRESDTLNPYPYKQSSDLSEETNKRLEEIEKNKESLSEALRPLEAKRREFLSEYCYHRILGNLYLGNNYITTRLTDFGENPDAFQALFVATRIEDQDKYQKAITKNHIDGFYLGQTFPDDVNYWPSFIYNATFPNRPVSEETENESPERILKSKQEKIDKIPVTEWCEAFFKELDKAIFEDKKSLVHCSAGASRSPTLVAAYLINRFGFTAEEAMIYLMTQRPDVAVRHFYEPLQEYQKALFAARNLAAAAEGKKLPHPPKTAEVVSGDKTEMQEDKTE